MRKTFILLLVLFCSVKVVAQEDLGDCIRRNFLNTDSLLKAGKNPFEDWVNCVLDKKLPDLMMTSMSGDTIKFEKLAGKVIVLNFWSIDCHPCIAEMPGMNKLVKDYKDKDIVFIAMTWETVKRINDDFLPRYRFDFMIVPDVMPLINQVWGSGFPTTYIVNKNGVIKKAWAGGRTDDKAGKEYYEKTKEAIDKLLKTDASASLNSKTVNND